MLAQWWDGLPEPMRDPTVLAIPFFVLFVVLEVLTAVLDPGEAEQPRPDGRPRHRVGSYQPRDFMASIGSGLVSIGTTALFHALFLGVYVALFSYVAPWHLPNNTWWAWLLVMLVVDLVFYFSHRVSHRMRLIWATHQAHHSSEYFNFGTALRQKWNPTLRLVMWLPLPALGIEPAMLYFAMSINLVYQFLVHTERVGTLWRPIEFVMNTPSHHRVHHGMDPEYLDKNYAGILIIWDRMFGTFQPEIFRPTYGLTYQLHRNGLWYLQTHEYAAILRDLRAAGSWRDKLGYVFGPPGWQPAAIRTHLMRAAEEPIG